MLMVVAGVRFDSKTASSWVPTRQSASSWVDGARTFWPLALEDYRDRVTQYYADQLRDSPDAFPLMRPTRVIVVVSLLRAWVFATPTATDEVDVREMWEDPVLADWSTLRAPNLEAQVRKVAGLSADLELIDTDDMQQLAMIHRSSLASAWRNRRIPALSMIGWELADHHERTRVLIESDEELRGYGMDRARLRVLADHFETLDEMKNPNTRGLEFEDFMLQLLSAHGFEIERGKHREGEQVDLIVHRPTRALVECRWHAKPVGRPAVSELIGKLTRDRPAIISGIYVSMTGFTKPAQTEAREHARDRVVLLLDQHDVLALLQRQLHARDLIDERIDELVRRYER